MATKTARKTRKPSTKSPKKAPARKTKTSSGRSSSASVSKEEVTIDRRRGPRRAAAQAEARPASAPAPKLERRQKVNRRRQIDPTTCERDYTEHEVEFMNALDDYKRKSGRMFPTCSEVLEVVRALGYVKRAPGSADTYVVESQPADEAANDMSLPTSGITLHVVAEEIES